MKKYTIPTILAVTIMVAGMFAFMPVEQASTVHLTSATTLAANSVTASVIDADAIGTSELATAVLPMNVVVVRDYSGAASDKAATSTLPFILYVCASNSDTTVTDTLTIERGASTIIYQAEIDTINNQGVCITVNGVAGESYEITVTAADGTSSATATLVTQPGAAASIAA